MKHEYIETHLVKHEYIEGAKATKNFEKVAKAVEMPLVGAITGRQAAMSIINLLNDLTRQDLLKCW